MKSAILLNLVAITAAASGAQSANNDRDVVRQKNVGLRGLSGGSWKRVPGQPGPFVANQRSIEASEDDGDDDAVDDAFDGVFVWDFDEDSDGEEGHVVGLLVDVVGEDGEEIRVVPMSSEGRGGKRSSKRKKEKGRYKRGAGKRSEKKRPEEKKRSGKSPEKKFRPKRDAERESSASSADAAEDQDGVRNQSVTPSPTIIGMTAEDFSPDSTEQPTMGPATIVAPAERTASLPICPPHYSAAVAYAEGDTIEENSHIYECRAPPYEAYCKMDQMDESWADDEKDLWEDAWAHVRACEKIVAEEELVETADTATTTIATTTAAPATSTSTTDAPVDTTTEAPVDATTAASPVFGQELPPCPEAYDTAKTTYVAGELATVKSHIFKCSEEGGYEMYCNVAVWDDGLLEQDADAEMKWHDAWGEVGPCEPTQMELMEEEAEADGGEA